jgi:RNA polymerase sigma factor (TIGR02999 family)
MDPLEITALIGRWREGDRAAEGRLMELLYPTLREMAARHLRRDGPRLTLQPTELVNEVYLRLRAQNRTIILNRSHFLGIAAHVMRRLIVDLLRHRYARKRGRNEDHVDLDDATGVAVPEHAQAVDLMALNTALDELETRDAAAARLVELRYFAGMTLEEVAEMDEISVPTLVRRWRATRAWLSARLEAAPG